MPMYDYHCKACGYSFEKNVKIAEMDLPTQDPCPECKAIQTISKTVTAPGIGDPMRLGVTKVPSDFQKYVLGRIKEAHPKGNVERSRSIAREI